MTAWRITETREGVQFSLKIQPRAAKNEVAGLQGDALKVRLTAPPVDGEANEACIKFLAQLLGVAKSAVEIVTGHTGRNKIVLVRGIDKEQLMKKLSKNFSKN